MEQLLFEQCWWLQIADVYICYKDTVLQLVLYNIEIKARRKKNNFEQFQELWVGDSSDEVNPKSQRDHCWLEEFFSFFLN